MDDRFKWKVKNQSIMSDSGEWLKSVDPNGQVYIELEDGNKLKFWMLRQEKLKKYSKDMQIVLFQFLFHKRKERNGINQTINNITNQ